MDELTKRRYGGNEDAWSLKPPSPNDVNRVSSTRSKTFRNLDLNDVGFDLKGTESNNLGIIDEEQSNKQNEKSITRRQQFDAFYTKMKVQIKSLIIDQWRRATQSGNDPYVKIELKPTAENHVEECFATLPILGGGSSVAFDPIYDKAQYTFLCGDDINCLTRKYLRVCVFDKETGTRDRLIGTAHILLKQIKDKLGKTQFATVSLFGGVDTNYQWSGTVEIEATFKKINLDKVQEIRQENQSRLSGTGKSQIASRNRSATDAIMLSRMRSDPISNNGKSKEEEISEKIAKKYEKEQEEKRLKDESKTRIIQGFIVDFVLFASLILSGTLFYGAMDLYEVDAQTDFMRNVYDTDFSIIDSFRFSIVTVTTIGYGDFYPQTTGGRIFGSFVIIFGVSLLARLLSTVLDRAAANYQIDLLRRVTNRRAVTHDSMEEFDEDNDGVITNYEFLKTMLIRRGDTTKECIDEIMLLFDKYDVDGSGEIELEEIKDLIKKNQQQQEEKQESEQQKQHKCELDDDNKDDDDDDDDDDIDDNNFEYGLTVKVSGCDNLKEADDLIAAEDSFWSFMIGWLSFILYLVIGAAIFSLVEDRKFGDMLWFFIVTTCTVGYGDVYPITKVGKILNGFFISISVVLFVSTFSSTFDYLYARQEALIKQKTLNKKTMDEMVKKFPALSNALQKIEKPKIQEIYTTIHCKDNGNLEQMNGNNDKPDLQKKDTLTALTGDEVINAFKND